MQCCVLPGRHRPEVTNRMAFALSDERIKEFAEILSRYPNKMAACIPVLHLCQEANDNWVSDEVTEYVAEKLELSAAHVKGVAPFYSLFNREKPGKHQVWVCRTLSCAHPGRKDHAAHRGVFGSLWHGSRDAGQQRVPREPYPRIGGRRARQAPG